MLRHSQKSFVVSIIIGLSLIFVVLVGMQSVARSQDAPDRLTISISPQSLDIAINPGESATNVFRLTNASDDTITVATTPKNFLPRGVEGAIDLTEDDTPFSLANWISVSPDGESVIEPRQSIDYIVTIDAPDNAEPGGHFGSVVFRTVPTQGDGAGAVISQELAPVILVRIPGDVDESGRIARFVSTQRLWTNQPAIEFDLLFENTGTVHYQPSGQVVVRNLFGREVDRISVEGRNVIPDAERKLDATWEDYGFRFGYYSAEATLVHGSDNEITTSSTNFWIIPVQQLAPFIIALAILGFVTYRLRRRLKLAFKALTESSSKSDEE